MALPVFFPVVDVAAALPGGRRSTVRQLCRAAGVECRVVGAPAERCVILAEAPLPRALRTPGPLGPVWLGLPRGDSRRRALQALGLLAYGVFDYCARESLRGLPIARPTAGPGRPRTGTALSAAERQRRYRGRRGVARPP